MSPKTDAAHRQIEQTLQIEQTGEIIRCKPVKKPNPRIEQIEWNKRAGPQDVFRRNMIESKFHFRGYRTSTELEQDLGVHGDWVGRRIRGETSIRLDELELLDSVLNFTDTELAQIVRGRNESKD